MQLTLEKADIMQAIRDYIHKLGYVPKNPIVVEGEISLSVTVEKYYPPSYGGCEKS
jgi:hypothetical protein